MLILTMLLIHFRYWTSQNFDTGLLLKIWCICSSVTLPLSLNIHLLLFILLFLLSISTFNNFLQKAFPCGLNLHFWHLCKTRTLVHSKGQGVNIKRFYCKWMYRGSTVYGYIEIICTWIYRGSTLYGYTEVLLYMYI